MESAIVTGVIFILNIAFYVGTWHTKLKYVVTREEVRKMMDEECNKGVGEVNKKFTETNKRADNIKKEVDEIRSNYLERFDEVKTLITDKHEETLNQLSEIKSAVASQAAVCKLIQDQKRK